MLEAMRHIVEEKTHHAERADAMLRKLSSEITWPFMPTYDEMNPPPPVPKEYKLSLGDTLYIGAQQYELLSLGDEEVTLFDPSFPLFHKVYPRQEFFDLLKENPLNDKYLQEIRPAPAAEEPAGDVPFDVEVERQLAEDAAAEFCRRTSCGSLLQSPFWSPQGCWQRDKAAGTRMPIALSDGWEQRTGTSDKGPVVCSPWRRLPFQRSYLHLPHGQAECCRHKGYGRWR
jgi:hypothetical protein